jgi:hypothetical protein
MPGISCITITPGPSPLTYTRRTWPGHALVVLLGQARSLKAGLPLPGQGVVPGPEQQLHLLGSDLVPDREPVDPGQPGP